MKVRDKLKMDFTGLFENGPINIVVMGDSVSHGAVNGYIDYEGVYWNLLKRKLNQFRSYIPVNVINTAMGGTTAEESVTRLDSQVFRYQPDLIIACFGLNDVNFPLENFLAALETLFSRCREEGFDLIFLTPNMLNTYVADDVEARYRKYSAKTAEYQREGGRMDQFMDAARALAVCMGVTVCDCYAKWKELSKTTDTTMLLANRVNHPTTEMHRLFADSLYETIMGEGERAPAECSTMIGDRK